ncbi:MAG: aquaporin [Gemmatimonadales bacterium]|nr:aquaporin [Gemmatimonadales bacterium]
MTGWRSHWVEYGLEAFGLGLFMLSAAGFGVLLFHPEYLPRALPDPLIRRALMGLAMGATAVLNVYSPWGRRSGAHLNPATTLTFFHLGKVAPGDVVGYVAGQFVGAIGGMAAAAALLRPAVADPAVAYVVTVPGSAGAGAAFAAEVVIAFILMAVVLHLISDPARARWAGVAAAVLVACFITVEAPLSGMSLNPARTTGSALASGQWDSIWLYFVAPPLGMLAAAAIHRRRGRGDHCAKLDHDPRYPCIFCRWAQRHRPGSSPSPS